MGYSTEKHQFGTIRNYWPDDDDDTIYIAATTEPSLSDILELCEDKWPGITPNQIEISAENIHTNCLGYDLYDASDYTDFITIKSDYTDFIIIKRVAA